MKCQFHSLFHVDDGGLQLYSEIFFNIYSLEFAMFFQIFVSKQYNFDQQTFGRHNFILIRKYVSEKWQHIYQFDLKNGTTERDSAAIRFS